MVGRNGDSVETIRELIAVPAKVEAVLLAYAKRHPEDQQGIEGALEFRRRVAEEFERLVLVSQGEPSPVLSPHGPPVVAYHSKQKYCYSGCGE